MNKTPQAVENQADQFTQPKANFEFSLTLSVNSAGTGMPNAALVQRALADYSEQILKHMIHNHNQQDYASAAAWFRDYEKVAAIQSELFDAVAKLAEDNQWAQSTPTNFQGFQQKHQLNYDTQEARYREHFGIKPDQEGGQEHE